MYTQMWENLRTFNRSVDWDVDHCAYLAYDDATLRKISMKIKDRN